MTSDAGNSQPANRSGAVWLEQDYASLVSAIRDGLTVDDIARTMGRTVGSINGRLAWVLPKGFGGDEGDRQRGLRELLLSSPDYDWRAAVAAECAHRNQPYWSIAHQAAVQAAWEAGTPPLRELSLRLEVSEQAVVKFLRDFGLAVDTIEVTDRLGCDPNGVVAAQRRSILDKQAAIMWVLSVCDREGEHIHVSLHGSESSAYAACRSLVEPEKPDHSSPVRWYIALCVPGGGHRRGGQSGSGYLAKGAKASAQGQAGQAAST